MGERLLERSDVPSAGVKSRGANVLLGKGTYGCVYEVDMAGEKRAMKYFVCRKNQLHLNNLHRTSEHPQCWLGE